MMKHLPGIMALCALAFASLAAESRAVDGFPDRGGPILLYQKPVPPIREIHEPPPSFAPVTPSAPANEPLVADAGTAERRYAPVRDHRRTGANEPGTDAESPPAAPEVAENDENAGQATPAAAPSAPAAANADETTTSRVGEPVAAPVADAMPEEPPEPPPPTPEAVENYRVKLEQKLLERYNNLPATAGRVAKVAIVLAKPLEVSLDGRFIRAEFDQLVYDIWGKRLPVLEKEYYVVTFGSGGAAQVRSDPSIRVGLDYERNYSELAPLAGDPFRHMERPAAPIREPQEKMPNWWRPEYPELR